MFSHTSSRRSLVAYFITRPSKPDSLRLAVHLASHPSVFSYKYSPRSLAAGLVTSCCNSSLPRRAIDLFLSFHCSLTTCPVLITCRCSPRSLAAGGASLSFSHTPPHCFLCQLASPLIARSRPCLLFPCICSYTPSHALHVFTALSRIRSRHVLLQGDLSLSSYSLVFIFSLLFTRMPASDHTPLLTTLCGCWWRLLVLFSDISSQRPVAPGIVTFCFMPTFSSPVSGLTPYRILFAFSWRSLAARLIISCCGATLKHLPIHLLPSFHCAVPACLLLILRRCSPRSLASGGASLSCFLTSSPRSVVDDIVTSSSKPTSLRFAVHLLSHPLVFSHRSCNRALWLLASSFLAANQACYILRLTCLPFLTARHSHACF